MLSRKAEIKEYEIMLKRNEEDIARLTGLNKHIKTHLKFLRSLDAEEKGLDFETTGSTINATRPDIVALDGEAL